MNLIGFDFVLPEPRVIIKLPTETKKIFVGDLNSICEMAPPEHRELVRAMYRVGYLHRDYKQFDVPAGVLK